ncbi:MAG: beta-ketoacyl-[acyl-carrier-protein] synthase family protein [Oligoflexia bacterium]|nr:beta-ketoacyl-[acyl-carrier-protein] synthase family protein [Oligoflexia bacterium]
MKNRVVITGLGVVTPLGLNIKDSFFKLLKGKSAECSITRFDASSFPSKIACEIDQKNLLYLKDHYSDLDNDYKKLFPYPNDLIKIPEQDLFLLKALEEAWEDSQFENVNVGALIVGAESGLIDFDRIYSYYCDKNCDKNCNDENQGNNQGNNRSDFDKNSFAIRSPTQMLERVLKFLKGKYNLKNENIRREVISLACASSTAALIRGYREVKRGNIKRAIVAGTFCGINPHMLTGFTLVEALTKSNVVGKSSRPFDHKRDGFVLSEGAGVLIIEELELAKKRGAKIYAEIVGAGISSDAYKMTDMDTSATGAINSIQAAISDAGDEIKRVSDIGYVNAHGTSTQVNDRVESLAISSIFKEHCSELLISSNKSMIGHTIAACGAIESCFTIKTLESGLIPANINFEQTDIDGNLNYVTDGTITNLDLKFALKNSFAFGGSNCSLIFKKWE